MRPVPSELVRGEGYRGLVRCLMAGCFACGAGESCRPFGLLLGGLVWAQESPPQP